MGGLAISVTPWKYLEIRASASSGMQFWPMAGGDHGRVGVLAGLGDSQEQLVARQRTFGKTAVLGGSCGNSKHGSEHETYNTLAFQGRRLQVYLGIG